MHIVALERIPRARKQLANERERKGVFLIAAMVKYSVKLPKRIARASLEILAALIRYIGANATNRPIASLCVSLEILACSVRRNMKTAAASNKTLIKRRA